MDIVFFGATGLGYKCCKLIIEEKLATVKAIYTIPKHFMISYSKSEVLNVNFADFHSLGKEFDIPVIDVTGKMNSHIESIRKFKPDLLLAIGWYYIIPRSMREIAALGCAGIHASLLPKYRGGAPLVWAMINGEKETGISFFYLDDGIDNGNLIAQERFSIEETDTISDLMRKTELATIELISKYIPLLAHNKAPRIKQDESNATYYPQRSPEDGAIDWNKSPDEIKNFIRAQSKPYPGAFTIINGMKVHIWDADIQKL